MYNVPQVSNTAGLQSLAEVSLHYLHQLQNNEGKKN